MNLALTDGNSTEVLREAKRQGVSPVVVVVSTADERFDFLREVAEFRPAQLFLKPVAAHEVVSWIVDHWRKGRGNQSRSR